MAYLLSCKVIFNDCPQAVQVSAIVVLYTVKHSLEQAFVFLVQIGILQ